MLGIRGQSHRFLCKSDIHPKPPVFVDSACLPWYTLEEFGGEAGNGILNVINVGFGNYVSRTRIVAIVSPDSSPVKRAVQEARKEGCLIDATQGRKTKSVLFIDDGRLVVSGLGTDTLAKRIESILSEDSDADLG